MRTTTTDKKIVDFYLKGHSLSAIYREFGINFYQAKLILEKYNVPLRKEQIEYKDIIEALDLVGISKDEIYKFYIEDGKSQSDLKKYIFQHTNYKVGDKVITSLLKHFDIKKTPDQIKRAQAKKSLSEKAYSFSALKQAGFDSPKALAEFYESNKNMTYKDICAMLNKKLGKEVFTERWLGRHMAKELSEVTKEKVSVSENSLAKYISSIYNGQIDRSTYDVIPPKEIDIYLPEKKIAIEFNGLYWHSDKFIISNHNMTAYDYHYNKFIACAEQDIQIVFIWEDDWDEEKDVIQNAIKQLIEKNIVDPKLMRLQ